MIKKQRSISSPMEPRLTNYKLSRCLFGDLGEEMISITPSAISRDHEDSVMLRRRKAKSVSDQPEIKHRSSLIMMTVAHNSPRSKVDREQLGTSMRFSSYFPLLDGPVTPLSEKSFIAISDMVSEDMNNSFSGSTSGQKTSLSESVHVEESRCESEHDGAYFLDVVDKEEQIIMMSVNATEMDLESRDNLSEEVAGILRAAAGKGRLFIKEKLAQFRGLCNENLNADVDSVYVTKSSDLSGFWDMCQLQLQVLRSIFKEVQTLRDSNFVLPLPTALPSQVIPTATAVSRTSIRPVRAKCNSALTNSLRDDARKRLLAAKREAKQRLQENQYNAASADVIF